jgi:hypothetical protein
VYFSQSTSSNPLLGSSRTASTLRSCAAFLLVLAKNTSLGNGLCKRIPFAFALTMIVTACSVRPLYDDDHLRQKYDDAGITVGVIPERDGQRLRSYLVDLFRDLPIADGKYLLDVRLNCIEKSYAYGEDGYAKRQFFTHVADINLMDNDRKTLLQKQVKIFGSHNISRGQWGIEVSLYGRHNSNAMKELAYKIVEEIRVFLSGELRKKAASS